MLSFKNIKKFIYSIAFFSVLLFYSVPARPESADTALAQTILGNIDANTRASLVQAFGFKDIVLNKKTPTTPILDPALIKHFGIYDMFSHVDANTITFFAGVALEDMLSNPSYTVEDIKRKQDIIQSFVALDDQTIIELKKILSALGGSLDHDFHNHDEQKVPQINSLEMMVLDPAKDILNEWTELQQNPYLGDGFLNNFSKGRGWYDYVYLRKLLFSMIPIIGVKAIDFVSESAWGLFSTIAPTPLIAGAAAISSNPAGSYWLPLLGFSLAYAIFKTMRQDPPRCCIAVAALQAQIAKLAKLLLKIKNPLHHEFIEKLMGIIKIDPKFNEDPNDAALSIIEALYAVAQIDAYLALADFVRSEEYTFVQYDEKESTVNRTYLDDMYESFKEPKSVRVSITSSQNNLTVTLPKTLSQETVTPVLSLFHVHYMAQTLGIVPAKFKDELFCPLHFDDMTLEIFTLSHKEKVLEIPRTISFPKEINKQQLKLYGTKTKKGG